MDDLVERIQTAYPRIWHAAHRHPGRETGLSERDQRLLSHLASPVETRDLAEHLAIAPSTLSEHLADLERRGLVARERVEGDRRRVVVVLTAAGRAARADQGPLDPQRLVGALERLGPDAPGVVAALERLAEALA